MLFMVVLFPASVSGHTPSIITSNLSVDGPLPANITETTEFYEGDSVYFRMGDSGENVTMRVSIDIDGDGIFNQSNDIFSNWLNYSCELNENGTATLDENCSKSFTYQFSENNSEGIYHYQVERRVGLNHTNTWLNTIYVGIDIHSEDGVVSIGDCFGIGCDDENGENTGNEEVVDQGEMTAMQILLIIVLVLSVVSSVGLMMSIINERQEEEKDYSLQEEWFYPSINGHMLS